MNAKQRSALREAISFRLAGDIEEDHNDVDVLASARQQLDVDARERRQLIALLEQCASALREEVLAAGDLDNPVVARHSRLANRAYKLVEKLKGTR